MLKTRRFYICDKCKRKFYYEHWEGDPEPNEGEELCMKCVIDERSENKARGREDA